MSRKRPVAYAGGSRRAGFALDSTKVKNGNTANEYDSLQEDGLVRPMSVVMLPGKRLTIHIAILPYPSVRMACQSDCTHCNPF